MFSLQSHTELAKFEILCPWHN